VGVKRPGKVYVYPSGLKPISNSLLQSDSFLDRTLKTRDSPSHGGNRVVGYCGFLGGIYYDAGQSL
jgi:hypothetical protein